MYQLGSVYFVLDGNHRVSVARQMGAHYIQAYVTEVHSRASINPDVKPDELILIAEYNQFLEQTRLDEFRPGADLQVTIPGQYPKLLEHIEVHRYFMGLERQGDIPYDDAVTHWYDTVYLPVVQIIWEIDLRHKMNEMLNKKPEPEHILPEQADTLSQVENQGGISSVAKEVPWHADAFRWAVESLKGRIKVEPIPDSNLFTINVKDFSPVAAATIANVVSRSYIIFDLEQQMAEFQLQYGEKHPIVVQLGNGIDKITKSLTGETLPAIEAIGPASVKIIEQALVPIRPTGKSKGLILLLATVMSLFLGGILAFGFFNSSQEGFSGFVASGAPSVG